MKLKIEHPYLVFPVSMAARPKTVFFRKDGELCFDLQVRLAPSVPDFSAYIDVRRFAGQTVELAAEPETKIVCRGADSIDRPDLYSETWRPVYHYTEANGWNNDPNGLVQAPDGTYHMFYQFGPAGTDWNNMHWGHAVSRDLVRWEQRPAALFPDPMGTMYSGSGIIDREGRAGFGRDAILVMYTAAPDNSVLSEGGKYCQCLAYSTDGGGSFTKYGGNPVIPYMTARNRDPKVIWCDELEKYVCALYLDGNTYALLTSGDFLHWDFLQHVFLKNDAECPDLYPLTADDGTRHWIFSGASAKYLVGTFTGGKYVPEQPALAMHTGSLGYAAQTWSDIADGRRINIAWDRIAFPAGSPFASQMGVPAVHTLRRCGERYVLYMEPVKELQELRGDALQTGNGTAELQGAACEMLLTVPADGANVRLECLGQTLVLDRSAMTLKLETARGTGAACPDTVPVEAADGKITVRLFWDVCSLEVFTGPYFACFMMTAEPDMKHLSVTGDGQAELTVWPLKSIRG